MPGRPAVPERLAVPSQLAVLGWPIAHSLSPRIHRAAYDVLGLPWRYSAVRCAVPELEGFLAGRGPEWRGFSVTMPLKEAAHRLATTLDPIAQVSGVVNTLIRRPDGTGWDGANTDVAGLAAAIAGANLDATRTVVLGTGATAVSAVLAAQTLGAEHVWVAGRNAESAGAIRDRLAARGAVTPVGPADPALDHADATLIIATLPGPVGHALPVPDALFGVPLFDVAYDPWPSPLAGRWEAAGGAAHPGTAMLIEQAIVQIRLFRGGDAATPMTQEDAVRAAMRAAITPDMGG